MLIWLHNHGSHLRGIPKFRFLSGEQSGGSVVGEEVIFWFITSPHHKDLWYDYFI
jgi:hypothetical protein